MNYDPLIDEYQNGPEQLRRSVVGMTEDDLDSTPIPGKWSTRQVVAHIADFEPIYADRMKRVIAQDRPHLAGGDPDLFAAGLAYGRRNIEVELQLIEAVRRHVTVILRTLPPETFERSGIHSEDGPVSLETLLRNITNHIPHHVRFIDEKRKAMA